MVNNIFYFILFYLLFSFLRYVHFAPHFSGYVEKRLDSKAKVNFKTMLSQTGTETITTIILQKITIRMTISQKVKATRL